MAHKIDLGSLTQDETKELASDCLSLLPFDEVVEALKLSFSNDMLTELAAQLSVEPE